MELSNALKKLFTPADLEKEKEKNDGSIYGTAANTLGNSDAYTLTTNNVPLINSSSVGISCGPSSNNTNAWNTFTTSYPLGIAYEQPQEISCKLPDDILQQMMLLGMANSKEMLKTKIKEAYKYWLETQKIKYETFPVLLVASMMQLGIHVDLIKEMEEKNKTEEK